MLSQITEAEEKLNALLPKQRLLQSPPRELRAAAREWSHAVWAMAEQLGPMPLTADELIKGLQLIQNPVFVCGVHRSGTTLVKDLLDGHPDLVVLPSEGTYYTKLETKLLSLPENERSMFLGTEWLRRLANPINQPPYWLLGRSGDNISPYVDFARYLMAWWLNPVVNPQTAVILAYASCMGKLGAKLWVDKTPTNERFLKRIWHEMPTAKIIHVVREPVATLTSRKKMEFMVNIRPALLDLKVSFKVAVEQSALKYPRFLLLRYEELCDDPQKVIAQITSFLNISYSEVLGKPTVAGMPSQANSSFSKQTVSGQILKPGQHRQEDMLNTAERKMITAYIGKQAQKLNYSLVPVGFFNGLYLRLKHRLFR